MGEPNQWTKNVGNVNENPLDNLLNSPSGLCPTDLVWEPGARRDAFVRKDGFVL